MTSQYDQNVGNEGAKTFHISTVQRGSSSGTRVDLLTKPKQSQEGLLEDVYDDFHQELRYAVKDSLLLILLCQIIAW